jgi:hypothetical protein
MNNILLITGESQIDKNNKSLGSAKDINYRIEQFQFLGYSVEIKGIKGRNDTKCLDYLMNINLSIYSKILFEHTIWPKSIKYCSSLHSEVYCRAHNAEGLHAIDRLTCYLKIYNFYSILLIPTLIKKILNIPKAFIQDYLCTKYSNKVLVCNERESNYWNFFKKNNIYPVNTITTTPNKISIPKKNNKILLIGSFLNTEFSDYGLKILINELKINKKNIKNEYAIVGNYKYPINFIHHNLSYMGVISSERLENEINSSKLILILTPYGRGIKTKVFEALSNGINVLMHINQKIQIPNDIIQFIHFWNGKNGTLLNFINDLDYIDQNTLIDAAMKFKLRSDEQFKEIFKINI